MVAYEVATKQGRMAMSTRRSSELLEANGIKLYCEVQGSGSPVIFISGATGDAGHFERVAEFLSDEFTVVTYDRRGNSRSPRLDGWGSTSPEQQSDDAAALIEALGISPAAIFAASSGAIIGLDLIIRHPGVVKGAILQEPPMMSVLAHPEEATRPLREAVEGGMARGGPPEAVEAFLRVVAGDVAFENVNPQLRERMLGNGETFLGLEFGTLNSYRPDDATLAGIEVPVRVVAGAESAPFFIEASRWLADQLDVELKMLSGAHTPYFDRPEEMAEEIRPLLKQLSKSGRSRR